MAALNKIMIMGNLGKDPEVRMVESGKKVATLSVGVTEKYKDRNNQQQEKTEWFSVILWDGNNGKGLASIAEQYLKKGSSVYIEGKLQTRSWDDSSGVKKYRTEVIGSTLQMLSKSSATQDNNNSASDLDMSFGAEDDLPY